MWINTVQQYFMAHHFSLKVWVIGIVVLLSVIAFSKWYVAAFIGAIICLFLPWYVGVAAAVLFAALQVAVMAHNQGG